MLLLPFSLGEESRDTDRVPTPYDNINLHNIVFVPLMTMHLHNFVGSMIVCRNKCRPKM